MMLNHANVSYLTGKTASNKNVLPTIIYQDIVQGDTIGAARTLSKVLKYADCPLSNDYLQNNLIHLHQQLQTITKDSPDYL